MVSIVFRLVFEFISHFVPVSLILYGIFVPSFFPLILGTLYLVLMYV